MLRLDECAGRPEVGAKAERLARAAAAGLPVLDGVVLLPGEAVDDALLGAALARLGGEAFIVRSSSALEDALGASAAGVFESVPGARGLDQVKAAIARVRASAEGEPARVYLAARGVTSAPLAVLIQPMARAEKLGVAMSAGGGWLAEERRAGEPEWGEVSARRVESGPLAEILRALEALVGGPVDAEYALLPPSDIDINIIAATGDIDINITAESVQILQARPRARGPLEALDAAFAGFAEPGRWRLDVEHNPRPLSAAQSGLVALVDALGVGARQRVVAGWLFVESGAPPRGLAPLPLLDLRRRFDEEVAPDCRQKMAEAAGLEGALAAYAHVYRRYAGEVAPSVRRAREQLDQLLRTTLKEPLAQHGALLSGVGGAALRRDQALWELGCGILTHQQYLARFGAWAPAWDVAAPPDDESEERVRAAARALTARPDQRHAAALAESELAASVLLERLDRSARRDFEALLPPVRAAVEVGEDDDALFFEAQRLVRRALLALSLPLEPPADVFELPLDAVRAGGADWQALVTAGRAARQAAERVTPPLLLEDGRPQLALPAGKPLLRGHATAGRARGRAVVVRDPAQAPTSLAEGAILVVPALLPSLAYLLPACRALVTAHGGATSHGATLAREYGVPAVLGVRGAEEITDGAELFVDGAAGRVYLL
jgi:phosphohistidine swiveling domain-containing protein